VARPVLRLLTFGGIGDVILTTPAIREWRRQHARGRLVVYCSQSIHREILLGNPHIDSLRIWRQWPHLPLSVARWIRGTFVFPNYSRLLPTISYRAPASTVIAEMLDLTLRNTEPEIFLERREDQQATKRLSGLSTPIALHTTGMCTPNKAWPTSNFEELVRGCPEYTFVQLGRESETLVKGAVDMRGLALRDSFATIKHCTAFIGVDSGPAHAAAAFKIPSVVLWGPTAPDVFGHPRSAHLYARARCSPCIDILGDGQCPYDRACMTSISVVSAHRALRNQVGTVAAEKVAQLSAL
jgi:ADP-heptose:LPS heptosyltransferase